MKLPESRIDLGAESGEDLQISSAAIEARLEALRDLRRDIATEISERRKAALALDEAVLLLELERFDEAFRLARPAFESAMNENAWELAIQAADIMFRTDHADSLSALGQGVWLAVTFPVDPELTITLLQHIIDETPDDADGAAVAAATAAYVVDLRAQDRKRQDLSFLAMQMLGTVARRHGGVENQDEFDAWAERLELTDPDKFLIRLRNVIDVLVQDDWWFDRDRIRDEIPMH